MLDLLIHSLSHASVLGMLAAEPGLADAIAAITTGLTPIFLPLAGLGLTIFFLLLIGSPVLPEAAQANKGYFMKVCVILIVVGMIPTLISWLYGLGGGTAEETEARIRFATSLM